MNPSFPKVRWDGYIQAISNSLLFWGAWILTLYFVIEENPFWANLSIWIPTLFQFWLSFHWQFHARWRELYLAAATFFMAYFFETLLLSFDLVRYKTMFDYEYLPPLWIVGLWLFFSTTINRTLSLMNRSYFFAPLLGLAAPFSYFAGERVGACYFPLGGKAAFGGLFVVWTISGLLWIYINRELQKRENV